MKPVYFSYFSSLLPSYKSWHKNGDPAQFFPARVDFVSVTISDDYILMQSLKCVRDRVTAGLDKFNKQNHDEL